MLGPQVCVSARVCADKPAWVTKVLSTRAARAYFDEIPERPKTKSAGGAEIAGTHAQTPRKPQAPACFRASKPLKSQAPAHGLAQSQISKPSARRRPHNHKPARVPTPICVLIFCSFLLICYEKPSKFSASLRSAKTSIYKCDSATFCLCFNMQLFWRWFSSNKNVKDEINKCWKEKKRWNFGGSLWRDDVCEFKELFAAKMNLGGMAD